MRENARASKAHLNIPNSPGSISLTPAPVRTDRGLEQPLFAGAAVPRGTKLRPTSHCSQPNHNRAKAKACHTRGTPSILLTPIDAITTNLPFSTCHPTFQDKMP